LQWENVKNIFQVVFFVFNGLWSFLALSVRGEFEEKRALHSLLKRLLKLFKCKKKCCGKENPAKLGELSWSFKEIRPKVHTQT